MHDMSIVLGCVHQVCMCNAWAKHEQVPNQW